MYINHEMPSISVTSCGGWHGAAVTFVRFRDISHGKAFTPDGIGLFGMELSTLFKRFFGTRNIRPACTSWA
jgi:hypothetical protein